MSAFRHSSFRCFWDRAGPGNTKPKAVVKLFKSLEGHSNGLENTNDGLWIAEEVSERAYLVDWSGRVLHKVDTESHNTSGIAVGGGYLWMSANGRGVGRDPRPDPPIVPAARFCNAISRPARPSGGFVPAWPGGLHGATWNDKTQTLWLVAIGINALVEVDPKDSFRIGHSVPTRLSRPHGLDFEGDAIWCLFSDNLQIHKLERAGEIAGNHSAFEGRSRPARFVRPRGQDLLLRRGHSAARQAERQPDLLLHLPDRSIAVGPTIVLCGLPPAPTQLPE